MKRIRIGSGLSRLLAPLGLGRLSATAACAIVVRADWLVTV